MLNRIRAFFDQYLSADADPAQDPATAARCAAAALLLEMAHMDAAITPAEHSAITAAVRQGFGLAPGQADELLACAEEEREQAVDYHQFTSLINAHFDAEQRTALVRHLWQVAYADAKLCKHEEYLVRKVAQLLHVPHSAFIAAKHQALGDAAG